MTSTHSLKLLFMQAPETRGDGLATPLPHAQPTVTSSDARDALGAVVDDAGDRSPARSDATRPLLALLEQPERVA
jgi:hypothetical protein